MYVVFWGPLPGTSIPFLTFELLKQPEPGVVAPLNPNTQGAEVGRSL